MKFNENLIILRGDLSRAGFAKALGISENTLRNYEKGLSLPNFEVGMRICHQFQVTPEWLLSGEGPMRSSDQENSTSNLPQNQGNAHDQTKQTKPLEMHDRYKRLEDDISQEREERRQLTEENRQLSAENRRLWKENGDLRVEVAELKAELKSRGEADGPYEADRRSA